MQDELKEAIMLLNIAGRIIQNSSLSSRWLDEAYDNICIAIWDIEKATECLT